MTFCHSVKRPLNADINEVRSVYLASNLFFNLARSAALSGVGQEEKKNSSLSGAANLQCR